MRAVSVLMFAFNVLVWGFALIANAYWNNGIHSVIIGLAIGWLGGGCMTFSFKNAMEPE